MIFKKKSKKEQLKCYSCDSAINEKYSFCPWCGNPQFDPEQELRDFGMLGRRDTTDENKFKQQFISSDITIIEKLMGSLMNNFIKNIDKQFRDMEKTNISQMPNSIKIKIGMSPQQTKRGSQQSILQRKITEDQMSKMEGLPRTTAKTNIKRLSDKVIYELFTPGIISPQDVFVSKIESGYEIKAIGEKKVYVNSLPINLPLHRFSIDNDKLIIEFKTEE